MQDARILALQELIAPAAALPTAAAGILSLQLPTTQAAASAAAGVSSAPSAPATASAARPGTSHAGAAAGLRTQNVSASRADASTAVSGQQACASRRSTAVSSLRPAGLPALSQHGSALSKQLQQAVDDVAAGQEEACGR